MIIFEIYLNLKNPDETLFPLNYCWEKAEKILKQQKLKFWKTNFRVIIESKQNENNLESFVFNRPDFESRRNQRFENVSAVETTENEISQVKAKPTGDKKRIQRSFISSRNIFIERWIQLMTSRTKVKKQKQRKENMFEEKKIQMQKENFFNDFTRIVRLSPKKKKISNRNLLLR